MGVASPWMLLLILVVDVRGQFTYSKVNSGTCATAAGRNMTDIYDETMCESAATHFALEHKRADRLSIQDSKKKIKDYPPGCSHRWGELTLNTKSSSSSCSSFNTCLCFTAPHCSMGDLEAPNANDCFCGTTACTAPSFCRNYTSSCLETDCAFGTALTTNNMRNCKRLSLRCKCLQCQPKYYSEDCSKDFQNLQYQSF